ncbi:hypothetical protein DRQ32_12575 [bacterium]|nr:MAG: hypothetical protein DRQ32_12575 [bacterium]
MLALVNLIAQTQAEQAGGRRGAYGADGGRQGRGHGQRDGVLEHADELDLSEEQIAAIAALMEDFRAAMRELMGEGERGGRPTDEQRAQMQVLREAHITSVLEVLTEDQRIALEEIRAEQRESRHNERAAKHENRAAQTLEFLSTMLNLSDGQQEQIQAVVQAQQQKMQALNEEFHNAQSGERPSVEARTAHREAVQELRAEGRAAIVELLDEQQAELFEALGKLRQNGQHGQRDGRPPHGRS